MLVYENWNHRTNSLSTIIFQQFYDIKYSVTIVLFTSSEVFHPDSAMFLIIASVPFIIDAIKS